MTGTRDRQRPMNRMLFELKAEVLGISVALFHDRQITHLHIKGKHVSIGWGPKQQFFKLTYSVCNGVK